MEQTMGTMTEEYLRQQAQQSLKYFKEPVQDGSPILNSDDDPVNSPSHYQSYCKDGIDCITAMQHAFGVSPVSGFCICNAFKYIWRHFSKNGMQDIDKAIWYLNKYKELNKEIKKD